MRIISEKRVGSLRKIIIIDKPLPKLTKRHRENSQINKIRNKRGIWQYTLSKCEES